MLYVNSHCDFKVDKVNNFFLDFKKFLRYNKNSSYKRRIYMNRKIFGVIAAQPADMEQREILSGIMEQAKKYSIDIAVLSNIYNPIETDDALKCENEIYDLILSNEFDGFILISEAIINIDLQKRIIYNLAQQNKIPVVAIGTPLPDFVLPHFRFINTSDEDDTKAITNHLIEVHGFTNIDILTGHKFINASHLRVNGYKDALESHGISFDEQKVFFGDFWMNSGHDLANKYISGELDLPQAIICTNDYMAYGLLDQFADYGIKVPEDVTVIGYEYVRERLYHTPILTTYQRNRKALGVEAVDQLYEKLNNGSYPDVPTFEGKIINGDSCSCGSAKQQLNYELKSMRAKQINNFLNLFGQFDHRLTECRNIYDFFSVCRDFKYLILNVQEVYFCLNDSWYENSVYSDAMVCYSIFQNSSAISMYKHEFSKLFNSSSAAYYFNPLFFSKKTIGYVVLKCSSPDDYNYTFRNWLKSVANGLEILHMKNDIQYLTQCQSLSKQYDSLTNLYNEKGMEIAYRSLKNENHTDFIFILLKICIFDNTFSNAEHKVNAIIDVSDALKEFCGSHDICGRINDTIFACFINGSKADAELLADKLTSFLIRKKRYIENYGMDSFICLATSCNSTSTYSSLLEFGTSHLDLQLKAISESRILPHYEEMLKIRNKIYMNPEQNYSIDDICSSYSFSSGHFRSLYKKCFQISFYQDYINARISKAKFLLCTTNLYVQEIAEKCGYTDSKYFLRQFSKTTGYTPNQYRLLL